MKKAEGEKTWVARFVSSSRFLHDVSKLRVLLGLIFLTVKGTLQSIIKCRFKQNEIPGVDFARSGCNFCGRTA